MINWVRQFLGPKKYLKELIKYGITGGTGAIVDFGLLNVLVLVFKWPVYESVVGAFIFSSIVTYVMHNHWTFRAKRGIHYLFVFMLSSLIGLIINVSIMYFLIEGFDWYYNFAKLVAILVALIWNYGSAKTLIFRNKKK